jgi:general L-amino acid transport system permease protein
MVDMTHRPASAGSALYRLSAAWNNDIFRASLYQAVLFLGVIAMFWWMTDNAVRNMQAIGLTGGFGFMERPANFAIGESLIPYAPTDTYGRAILVGLLNTIKVSIVSCVLVTLIGVVLGVMRLSPNPLLSGVVQTYIEVIRNTPLLLQLFFWATVMRQLPAPRNAPEPLPGVFISQRGIKLPWIEWHPQMVWVLAALGAAVVGCFAYARWVRAHQERTGERRAVLPVAVALLLGLPAAAAVVLRVPVVPDVPVLRGFNFVGGLTLTPEFAALTLGLVAYTSAFVAEIVRSGIQAVHKGQWEAARSLGLPAGRIMRLVILPQTLRIVVPPMTSTYLNVAKNSSLAIAIGFPDVVFAANTTMNQTGQAVELIALLMAVYLTLSLSISLFMNWYNKHVAIKER